MPNWIVRSLGVVTVFLLLLAIRVNQESTYIAGPLWGLSFGAAVAWAVTAWVRSKSKK
jgi:hypothetical protein